MTVIKPPDGNIVHRLHMVCPKLLVKDERHGKHAAGRKYPDLIDDEGHLAVTVVFVPGSEIETDHPQLQCSCGAFVVEGEWH